MHAPQAQQSSCRCRISPLQRTCSCLAGHKLGHGHAVWALKKAKTMAELKSISQNLMHSSMGITDAIYSKLVDDDVHEVILGLGRAAEG
jgi:hypothetical protein